MVTTAGRVRGRIQDLPGAANPELAPTYYFVIFPWKLDEKEQTWTEKGPHVKNFTM